MQHDGAEIPEHARAALEALARLIERRSTDFRASVLLLSPDGTRLLDGAAPRLPQHYRDAIHGLPIGEGQGSCGTAAFRRQRVIVTDIERDPLWAPFRPLARDVGIRACWSEPIRSKTGEVLGTFALYYDEPREPSEIELRIIEAAASRAALLLEQARAGMSAGELVRAGASAEALARELD